MGVALGTFGWVLWNTDVMSGSEKGFLAMSYLLSMFAAVAVQKNTRDSEAVKRWENAQRGKVPPSPVNPQKPGGGVASPVVGQQFPPPPPNQPPLG